MSGAKIATNTQNPMMISPAMAIFLRSSRRRALRQTEVGFSRNWLSSASFSRSMTR